MSSGLLLAADKFLEAETSLSYQVGWLCLGIVVCLMIAAFCRAEYLRRVFFAREDPRILALIRISLASATFVNFLNLLPYWRMLWSDEGIFNLADARSRYGRTSLSGWSDYGGFFDGWGVLRFFWGKYSVLYMEGAPSFVELFMVLFFVVLGLYAIGFRARVTGLIACVMLNSIYNRNALYHEGTDTVFRSLWFIVIFARTDAAWSVDNWIRRWREDRRSGTAFDRLLYLDRLASWLWFSLWFGLFLGVANTSTTYLWLATVVVALGLGLYGWIEAKRAIPGVRVRYRHVASWPRLLMMGQLTVIYVTTGLVKTGSVWKRGDALYYAINLDHFYRFEGFTQQMSAWFGTNLYRLSTLVTLYWECWFCLLALGMALKFYLEHKDEPWCEQERANPKRVWISILALLVGYVLLYRLCILAYPYTLPLNKKGVAPNPAKGLQMLHRAYALGIPLAVVGWVALGRFPLRFRAAKLGRISLPEFRFDQAFVRRWFLGRRLWLGLGVAFHGMIVIFMNIGMFPFIMWIFYFGFFRSEDLLKPARRAVVWLRARRGDKFVPAAVDGWLAPEAPAQSVGRDTAPLWLDPRRWWGPLPDADASQVRGRFSDLWVALVLLCPLILVLLRALRRGTVEAIPAPTWATDEILANLAWGLLYLFLFLGAVFAARRQVDPRDDSRCVGKGPNLIPSTLVRTAVLIFGLWHSVVIVGTLLPNYSVLAFRGAMVRSFMQWRLHTNTRQSWRMFAPNPPRSNTFLRTIVVEHDGDRWDLRNNAFTYRPNPWIINDRMRKMQRRMAGKGKWYLRYWSGFQCREWTLRTGEEPKEIVTVKLRTRIPTPKKTKGKPYDPRKLKVHRDSLQTHPCSERGRLSPLMKKRRGMELSEQEQSELDRTEEGLRAKSDSKRKNWERRRNFGGSGPEANLPKAAQTAKDEANKAP